MVTSRSQLDRVLDPNNLSIQLDNPTLSHVSAMLAAIAAYLGVEIQTKVKLKKSIYQTLMGLREKWPPQDDSGLGNASKAD